MAVLNEDGPSIARYNILMRRAVDELKLDGDVERARVFAMLARAEALALVVVA